MPGTHDVDLGLLAIADIDGRRPMLLPRFDKSRDDRAPRDRWEAIDKPLDILLFEGWCVGARPQSPEDLIEPVNALEREEDRDGRWRSYVNAALEGRYRPLFDRIDVLTLLAAPGFEVVRAWRIQQENDLRAQSALGAPGVMTDDQIARFIQHYERLTRHILVEMAATCGRHDCARCGSPGAGGQSRRLSWPRRSLRPGKDSNLHGLACTGNSGRPARLPIPPPGQASEARD